MLPGDAPRPPTLEISHEWLWLANAAEWRPGRLLDQNVQAGEHDGVVLLPKQIVGPRSLREDEPHSSMRVRSRPLPASSSATDCRRRSALAGVLRRCRVSRSPSNSASGRIATGSWFWRVTTSSARSDSTRSKCFAMLARSSVKGTCAMASLAESTFYVRIYVHLPCRQEGTD